MDIKVSTGDYDVVQSGTLQVFDNSPIRFHFNDKKNILINFKKGNKRDLDMKVNKKGELIMTLTGFNSEKSEGTTSPIEIGTKGGEDFLFAFETKCSNEHKLRKFEYYFYQKRD